ncbi:MULTISPECIES: LysR family transcriptional regulator [Ochrobactrum]|uniref:LysR family transcriptional regulator n=1 Tax=Ochrobactrum chromiisoli TaxID=2993941 RepID=A0ABT3QPK7_9HYPH|nr:LysR family transcriptional regulator [Ochrobactrum chromiisoli]MCX2697553.1 LysR family transcriptional regulator [Ochrobactrum chromiisoli]
METLDAKELRMFMAVVRFGSIRAAAEHVRVAPSVVSRQIAETERNIGLPLFERTARGMTLTEAGELVLEHSRRVLEEHSLLTEQLGFLKGVQQRRVRILCGEGFLADVLQYGLGSFVKIYPDVQYDLQLGGTQTVLDGIANGDADIGIAYNPLMDARVRSLAISKQSLCVVTPPHHALLTKAKLELADCAGIANALLAPGHGITQLVTRVAADRGFVISPLVETTSIDVLRRFVIAGLGISFLPRFAVSTELARNAVAVRELSDPLLAEASAHLLVRARRRLPLSVERLSGFLANNMAAFR